MRSACRGSTDSTDQLYVQQDLQKSHHHKSLFCEGGGGYKKIPESKELQSFRGPKSS